MSGAPQVSRVVKKNRWRDRPIMLGYIAAAVTFLVVERIATWIA